MLYYIDSSKLQTRRSPLATAFIISFIITVIILKWCFYERILHDWRSFYSTKRSIFFMQIYGHAGL